MKFKEIETKYSAVDIKLEDFKSLCKSLKPLKEKKVSSYDYYYTKSRKEFIRYRAGVRPELTVKKKTSDRNNYVRVEINLPLGSSLTATHTLETVEAFCAALGFNHNFTIYKTCQIYDYEAYNLVYYVVYDRKRKELARFIEIEMSEEYPWRTKTDAWSSLLKIEKKLKILGITNRHRISRSLYEMFRKAHK